MDEVFARKDMIEAARLKALSVKSDGYGFLQVATHLGALLGSGWLLLFRLTIQRKTRLRNILRACWNGRAA